ncbi:RES family NAD+ phosphorylase, partial [Fusibacter bizertensis]
VGSIFRIGWSTPTGIGGLIKKNIHLPQLSRKEEILKDKIQEEIQYCTYCQPYDGGECIWILGIKVELNDLFDEYDVPEKSRENIAHHLLCPGCGHSDFEEYEIVGLEERFDKDTRLRLQEIEKTYGTKLDELIEYVKLYPTLILNNSLGRKISKEISSNNISSTSINGMWYRARVVSEGKVYGYDDLHVPQIGIPNEGRYNHSGQSFLYIARDLNTAVQEVIKSDEPSLVWIQEYESVEIDNILDMRNDWEHLGTNTSDLITALLSFRILDQPVDLSKKNYKPEYYITRFISDLARNAGYNGIIYNSTKSYSENVVIFDKDLPKIKCNLKPRVIIYDVTKEFDF